MSKMIMLNRTQSLKFNQTCYSFISSCIGVPCHESKRGKDFYSVKGIDIVQAYQLIAEPLDKRDALHCQRDDQDGWNFHKNEVVLISD